MPANNPGPLRFNGRVAVVTGAGRGMGRAHALLLAARGAGVIVNDIFDPALATQAAAEVCAEIERAGGKAAPNFSDISTGDGARALVELTVSTFGRIDIVVNNAGIMKLSPFSKLSAADFDRTMRVNAYGPFHVLREAWPHFEAQGYGRAVNVSSIAGLIGIRERVDYAASKAALVGMTRSLAAECEGRDIRVNTLAPSAVTRMSSAGARNRLAQAMGLSGAADIDELMRVSAELVAPVVAWLAHETCTANGEIIEAGAGHVARLLIGSSAGFDDAKLTIEAVRDNFAAVMANEASAIYPPLRT